LTADRTEAIQLLLAEAEAAHGEFEANELKGVYDQDWARWYGAYAVEHGIADRLGHDVSADRLAELLARSYAQFEQIDPKPSEPWAAYAARRIVEEL
jgi:hypothetical protein